MTLASTQRELTVSEKTASSNQHEDRHKSLRDWLQLLVQLLILPIVVAIAISLGESVIHQNESLAEAARTRLDTQDHNRQEELQTYQDRMIDLFQSSNLLQGDLTSNTRFIARIRTLTVLHDLDGTRKGLVISLLLDSGLLVRPLADVPCHYPAPASDVPVPILWGADLSEMTLTYIRSHLRSQDETWERAKRRVIR